jgi:hypothetical protein
LPKAIEQHFPVSIDKGSEILNYCKNTLLSLTHAPEWIYEPETKTLTNKNANTAWRGDASIPQNEIENLVIYKNVTEIGSCAFLSDAKRAYCEQESCSQY